tara:strand:- start:24 stop:551 length:528 start_codon:yes stop_codon:yes gene_type:complete
MLVTEMFEIKKFDLNNIITNKNLENQSIQYLKKNPCCKAFPNCTHPKYQSDPNLWTNENFYFLNKKIYEIICDSYNKILNIRCNMWVYYQEKNSILEKPEWHNHVFEDNDHQLSFLIYLSPTDLGTMFENESKISIITPETNVFYLWNSRINHSPQVGKNNKNRVVLAGACSIYL